MTDEKYILLIHKQLSGVLSTTERQELQLWLEQSENNRKLLQDLAKAWQISDSYRAAYEPDTEGALRSLKARIRAEQPAPQSISAKRSFFSPIFRVAAGILLLMAAVAVWHFVFRSPETHVAVTGPGEQKSILLEDGSTVVLNENSELQYPDFFAGPRQVRLSGEAYFDIARDEVHPFQVRTSRTKTSVLGTSFNVRAYASETYTEVEVFSGLVNLSAVSGEADSSTVLLKAGTRGVYEHLADTLMAEQPKTLNAVYWKVRQFRFRGHNVREALNEINKRLGTQIRLTDNSLDSCALTLNAPYERAENLVQAIADNFGAKWRQSGEGEFEISEGDCLRRE